MGTSIREIAQGVISTVIGGLLLSSAFFFINDVFFSTPDLNGMWEVEVEITETEFANFKNLKLIFIVMIEQNGNNLFGTAEKHSEESPLGKKIIFKGKSRIISSIKGHITNKYFLSDTASAHFTEKGLLRDSTVIQSLAIHSNRKMSGKFYSSVAQSGGKVLWVKKSI